MSEEERISAMREMTGFEELKSEPEVGIFWYLPEQKTLFDVRSLPISLIPKGLRTIPMLHKNVWAKNYFRAKAKGENDSIYLTDYTQIPRGRVWYENGQFRVTVGQWAKDCETDLTPLLKEEFSLPDFLFDYDELWDLGHGWSEHDFEIYAK